MSVYLTKEAKESAAKEIEVCIMRLDEVHGLPYQIGELTFDRIVKFLAEYRAIIKKEID